MLYSCTNTAAVSVKELTKVTNVCLYSVCVGELDVIVDEPKTQTIDVGANVRFYCRTITAPVGNHSFVAILSTFYAQ